MAGRSACFWVPRFAPILGAERLKKAIVLVKKAIANRLTRILHFLHSFLLSHSSFLLSPFSFLISHFSPSHLLHAPRPMPLIRNKHETLLHFSISQVQYVIIGSSWDQFISGARTPILRFTGPPRILMVFPDIKVTIVCLFK